MNQIPSQKFIHLQNLLKYQCTSIERCKQAHAFLIRNCLINNPLLTSKLISFLSLNPNGDLNYANSIFSHLTEPDSFICNTLLRAHAKSSNPIKALFFFNDLVHSGVVLDKFTYPFAITACARLHESKLGTVLHGVVWSNGFVSDLYVGNSLIQMYANSGMFHDARKMFDENFERDVVSWNAMITAYVNAGLFGNAFDWFDEMVKDKNLEPDSITMVSLISACSQLSDLRKGRELHCYAKEKMLNRNLELNNAIISMYCKCGDIDAAKAVFDDMRQRDVLTWTSMISGMVSSGNFTEALLLFGQMQSEKMRPDEFTIVSILSACSHIGALDQGRYAHLLLDKFKIKRDVVVQTALIDMYAKCGELESALQVFECTKEKNVYTWNAMLGGLAISGQGSQALEFFRRMELEHVVPDDVTFIALLYACSHSGFVNEGLEIFEKMKPVYNIVPRMEHYGCVVDLLGRAKLLQDALTFIEKMPIKPNVVLWASLIGACRAHKEVKLAEKIVKHIVELEPDACGRYVMLSNFYAGARRFDDALKVRNAMKRRQIDKVPGTSWIEHNGTVHQFVSGDKSHYMTNKIYMMVAEMGTRVKSVGHVSGTDEVLFDIDEEEKDQSLFLHSEKLAVAFGLVITEPGLGIRITKNLRVCSDCHSFLKAVSKAFDREIIARDRSRFHHFRDGFCSCNDFW